MSAISCAAPADDPYAILTRHQPILRSRPQLQANSTQTPPVVLQLAPCNSRRRLKRSRRRRWWFTSFSLNLDMFLARLDLPATLLPQARCASALPPRLASNSDNSAFRASRRDSLPDKRSTVASLPPGPPSSSDGQSVAEREVTRSGASDNGAAAPTVPAPASEQITPRTTASASSVGFSWTAAGTAGRAAPPKKRPAPADPSSPCAKKTLYSPYNVFRREQQPLLPPDLRKHDREKQLGELPPQL